ncbi:MAG: restriction endonuclease subunit S [Gluconobacter sp.]|uniref:restriction endonuclease subunit S n=1 Tax=Gluconobacter sp. TaxID=1876758 RepID=UPI0039E80360
MLPEGWKNVQLGEISKVTGGKRLPKGGMLVSHDTGYPYIRVTDMLDGGACISNIKYVPENLSKAIEKYRIFKDDLFITVAGTIGVIGSIPDELNGANLTENADRISEIKANKIFLMEFLRSPFIQSYIENVKTNNAQPKLALEQIRTFPILLPPLPEQKKIAAILSTWDRAIEGTEKLLANSQQQKKALMQQLLTGKKRLPGFTGEWKLSTLAACCKPQQWTTISSKDLTFSGFPVYGANGFIGYFSEYNHEEDTVTVTCRGSTCGTVSLIKGPSYITGNSMCLDQVKKNCSHIYLYYYLNHRGLKDIISGSAQPQIVGKAIQKVSVRLPPFPEQKAIAAVLTTADEEITSIESDLSRLRQEKKALMQQLLTGKRRVTVD